MPEVSRFYGIIITLYYLDHGPPHFHARYNEWRASIRIEDLTILDGKLPRRVMGLVTEWARVHQEELRENWRRIEAKQALQKINPLE